jgi:thymidylate kinase
MRSFPHTLLVSIEGNIGAGKSTLLQALRVRNPSFHFIDEPVGIWQTLKNEAGESLLEVYYKDPKRWSYTFQSCALMSRFQSVSQAAHAVERSPSKQRTVVVTERCLDTDFHVFTKMLCEDGCINSMELEIYRRLYEHLQVRDFPLHAANNPPSTSPLHPV